MRERLHAYWQHEEHETAIVLDKVDSYGACANAAYNGHLAMLQCLHNNNLAIWDHNTCAAAAAAGQLKCLKYARENGCSWYRGSSYLWNANTTALAAQHKQFDCLDYELLQGCTYDTRTIFYMSIADHPNAHRLLRATCKKSPILN